LAGAIWFLLGFGLGIWYRVEQKPDIFHVFAMLAFPLFCWFPIVSYFSTVALLNWLSWQQVAIVWLVTLSVCTGLWQRGQYLERQAINPLQGILDDYM